MNPEEFFKKEARKDFLKGAILPILAGMASFAATGLGLHLVGAPSISGILAASSFAGAIFTIAGAALTSALSNYTDNRRKSTLVTTGIIVPTLLVSGFVNNRNFVKEQEQNRAQLRAEFERTSRVITIDCPSVKEGDRIETNRTATGVTVRLPDSCKQK